MTLDAAADLVLKFYVKKSLCSRKAVEALDTVFWDHLHKWRGGLLLLPEHEEDRHSGSAIGQHESLFDAVSRVSPIRFGLCAVNMAGAYEGVAVFMQCSRSSLPPESNLLTVEVSGTPMVEGKATAEWARAFFRAFAAAVPLRYGQARTRAEFDAKNMVREKRSTRAVGVNLKRALPGLYWMNFLGRDYLDLIGPERFSAVPAPFVEDLDAGVCIGLDEDPGRWSADEYRQREDALLAHLGREYFFSKADPERSTKAPAFEADRED